MLSAFYGEKVTAPPPGLSLLEDLTARAGEPERAHESASTAFARARSQKHTVALREDSQQNTCRLQRTRLKRIRTLQIFQYTLHIRVFIILLRVRTKM